MKTKNIVTILLIAFILASCAPAVKVAPIETAIPTSTFTPIPPMPTITPTPAPENISDAKNLSVWVDEFVHAYDGKATVNGVEMDANQLTDEIRKNDDKFIASKNINGTTFLFLMVNNVPLALREGNGQWQEATFKNITSLFNKATGQEIRIGVQFDCPYYLYSERKKADDFVKSHFTSAIIESTGWVQIEKKQGEYTWESGDKAVSEAQKNSMFIRGDHLVYGMSNFKWTYLKDIKGTSRDELIDVLKTHVREVVVHYKDKINLYTVVNEYLDNNPNDPFAMIIGSDYVDIAFQTARETDPKAILLYNDTRIETRNGKNYSEALRIVKRLNQKGLIDGVGFQMHVDGSVPINKEELIATMQSFGVPVYITEFDVAMGKIKGKSDDEVKEIQAEQFKIGIEACLESGVCKSVDFWDIGDSNSWLVRNGGNPAEMPTLLDDELNPKPAYYSVLEVLYENLP